MLPLEELLRIREQLDKSDRIREILDEEGKILPSMKAQPTILVESITSLRARRLYFMP
jgi:hypothetical protein